MLRKFICAAAAAAFVALLTACGESPTVSPPPPLPTPTPVGLQTPQTSGIYLGAYVPQTAGGIGTLEKSIGRKFALDMHYYGWVGNFPHLSEVADIENGRFSVDSWDCGLSDAQLASGAADMLITTRAQSLKAYGHPVFLRFFWDMNLPSSTVMPYSGDSRSSCYDPSTDNADGTFSAAQFVAAWNHVRRIFAQQGATNVIWVWNVAASGANPSAYYPGDAQVDWIGIDAYEDQNASFQTLFAPSYAFAATYKKPILVAETGTSAGNQQNFLTGLPSVLQSQFPLVAGFMYFDGGSFTLFPSGITALTADGQNPYMNGFGTP
jgi:hypothetical protein